MALSALDLYEGRMEVPTLVEAVADCHCVGTTSARKGFYRDHALDARDFADVAVDAATKGEVALVFGPEDKGLSNDDLKVGTGPAPGSVVP